MLNVSSKCRSLGNNTTASLNLQRALTRAESAKFLGISTRKLDSLATDGKIIRTKIGSKSVFLISDLDDFLDSCRVTDSQSKNTPEKN